MNKLILIMLLFSSGVMAQPMVWTGDGDGISFNDADNWDTNTKPTASNQLFIEDDSVVIRSVALAYSLELDRAKLTILSDLTISNADTFGISGVLCAIYNEGNIFINEAGNNHQDKAFEITSISTLINRGNIRIKNAFEGLHLKINSTLINEDVIFVDSRGSSLRMGNGSTAINSDSIIIANTSTSTNSGIILTSSSEFENDGLIEIMIDGVYSTGISCNYQTTHFKNNGQVEILVLKGRAIRIISSSTCELLDGDLKIIMEDDAGGISVTSSSTLIIAASTRLEVQNVPEDSWIDVEEGSTLTCHGDLIME